MMPFSKSPDSARSFEWILRIRPLHCKKNLAVFPSPAGKFFLARESLASAIPAGDGKIANLTFFYSVVLVHRKAVKKLSLKLQLPKL